MDSADDDDYGDFVMVTATEAKPVAAVSRAIVPWRPIVASMERRLLMYLVKKALIAAVHLYGAHWTALRVLEWMLGV